MHAKSDKQGIETTDFLLNILTIIKLIRCKIRNIFPYSCRNNLFSDFLCEKKRRINKQDALLERGIDKQIEIEKKISIYLDIRKHALPLRCTI